MKPEIWYKQKIELHCEHCGTPFVKKKNTMGRFCSMKCMGLGKKGEKNPGWKGDNIKPGSGRNRAIRMYPEKLPCCNCGYPKSERHHIDGNTVNNLPENIMRLCKKCHMTLDGRLQSLLSRAKISPPHGRLIMYKGITKNLVEWSKEVGLKPSTIRRRIDYCGYSVDEALTTPLFYRDSVEAIYARA